MAVETTLGWVLQGPSEQSKTRLTQNQAVMVLKVETSETELQQELQKFWDLESMGITRNSLDATGDEIVEEFEQNIVQQNGRYQVSLPWKQNVNLESNKENAMKRLQQLTKRLQKNEDVLRRYDKARTEYMKLDGSRRRGSRVIRTEKYTLLLHATSCGH